MPGNPGRKLVALCAALAVGVATLVAAGPASAKLEKRYVYALHIVPANKRLAFTVSCPRGWLEVGGEILSNPRGIPAIDMKPRLRGSRSMRLFSFDNRLHREPGVELPELPAEVRVRITCVRYGPVGKRRSWSRVGTSKWTSPRLKASELPRTVKFRPCPKGHFVVGPGIYNVPAREGPRAQAPSAPARGSAFPVDVSRFWIGRSKGRDELTYRIEGQRLEGYDVRIATRCLAPVALSGPMGPEGPRPATHRSPIRIATPDARIPVHPGINAAKANCPKGFLSIGAGHAFPRGSNLSVYRSFPVSDRSALWEIDSLETKDLRVNVQARCLDARPGWRKID